MTTFLFDKVIFGPVNSRRLGVSLGVNLLSPSSKHCNFDCIYCECGWNADHQGGSFNSLNAVLTRLEDKLKQMGEAGELPNYITFAGNGEPTMHPDFLKVIQGTLTLRSRYAPDCKVAVLSNGTMTDRDDVRQALMMVDRNILKLDSAFDNTIALINRPKNPRTVAQMVELYKKFNGCCVIQTMLIRGTFNDIYYDNTSKAEIAALLKAIAEISPAQVMLYSIDRDTPASGIEKVSYDDMELIAQQIRALDIEAIVS